MNDVLDEDLSMAMRLRENGANWSQIEREIGISTDRIRRRIDPEYRARMAQKVRRFSAKNYIGGRTNRSEGGVGPEEAARVIAMVPADTRSRTAKLCGDPLPGRSALDRLSH